MVHAHQRIRQAAAVGGADAVHLGDRQAQAVQAQQERRCGHAEAGRKLWVRRLAPGHARRLCDRQHGAVRPAVGNLPGPPRHCSCRQPNRCGMGNFDDLLPLTSDSVQGARTPLVPRPRTALRDHQPGGVLLAVSSQQLHLHHDSLSWTNGFANAYTRQHIHSYVDILCTEST